MSMQGLTRNGYRSIFSILLALIFMCGQMMTGIAFAQTGRPISGVIAATDKPIAVSYVNEDGETIGRIAGVGEPIYLNDEITTPAGASLQVLLKDQTVFSIGPNSTLVFDEFIFDPTSPEEVSLSASVKKGSFKFISGKISKLKPGAMTLKLPNATASVRGTSVVGRVSDTGASDIVLLTGAVQLATTAAPVVDLVQPGWGVSVGETGAASAPAPFSPEEIDTIIQEVETKAEDEAGEGEGQLAANEDGQEQGEEEPSEEAVESVAEVVREAGTEVSEEEIVTIIKEADGNPEAVAEAIVKVIIETRIESGDIDPEALADFENFIATQGEGGLDGEEGGLFGGGEFNVEALNVAELKGEDLGIEGFAFGGEASFVSAFSERLDTQVLSLPKFDETNFDFGAGQFEDVKFEKSFFSPNEIAVSQRFDIKEVSQLIVGNQFGDESAPEVELSFFDILFNAEVINEEITNREVAFGFEPGTTFGQRTGDDKGAEQPNDFKEDSGFDDGKPIADEPLPSPRLLFAQRVGSNGEIKTVIERPVFDEGGAPIGEDPAAGDETPSFDEAELFLTKLVEEEPKTDSQPNYYEEAAKTNEDEKASQDYFADLINRLAFGDAGGPIDPLGAYESGDTAATWLRLQSDGSLGNNINYETMISESYGGSVRFADRFAVEDGITNFKAVASYNMTLDYDDASVTGSFALSNMSLNGQTYYDASGATSGEETISNFALSGSLSAGDELRDVEIATLDFHNATSQSAATERVTTSLDMSVGSVEVYKAVLDGKLGEFRVESEHFTCNTNCSSGTVSSVGLVGAEVSVVSGE